MNVITPCLVILIALEDNAWLTVMQIPLRLMRISRQIELVSRTVVTNLMHRSVKIDKAHAPSYVLQVNLVIHFIHTDYV